MCAAKPAQALVSRRERKDRAIDGAGCYPRAPVPREVGGKAAKGRWKAAFMGRRLGPSHARTELDAKRFPLWRAGRLAR